MEVAEITLSILATKATSFFQLIGIAYNSVSSPGLNKGAVYFACDANMQPSGMLLVSFSFSSSSLFCALTIGPAAALKEFEVDAKRLPPLQHLLGNGASAMVYKARIVFSVARLRVC